MSALLFLALFGCPPSAPPPPDDDDSTTTDDDDSTATDDDDSTATDDDDLAPPTSLSAVWANPTDDKIHRHELRGSKSNSVWDGERVQLLAARNETVSFTVVLESTGGAGDVDVFFSQLFGPTTIESTSDDPFAWSERPIERFFVRYLPIEGLSRLSYETYDERHIPTRFQRPWTGEGYGEGAWEDRPDHGAEYPEIAVPLELESPFAVGAGTNQQIVIDVWVPPDSPPGQYEGEVLVFEGGGHTWTLPVTLSVRPFSLPDVPSLGAMVAIGYSDINERYLGERWLYDTPSLQASQAVRDLHFQMAHRHRVDLIGDQGSDVWTEDRPRDEWGPRLDGSLFSPAQGYGGPGADVPVQTYSIGLYGSWGWQDEGEAGMHGHLDGWATWFADNAPDVEPFLYLIDESSDYPQTEQWAAWAGSNPGPGASISTMATVPLPSAASSVPSLDQPASWITVGVSETWEAAAQGYRSGSGYYLYNGHRPATGSFATEDDGVSPRVVAWTQHKHGVHRWFYWESTYYDNFQAGEGATDVFSTAHTFGADGGFDPIVGRSGWNYSNGDGVLFYPGTDLLFPDSSYGVEGPIASLRLKHWRRGLQDGDYLVLAAAVDPEATQDIVNAMIPTTLWEHGVSDLSDPTWVRAAPSWSTLADDWDGARRALAAIIEGQR